MHDYLLRTLEGHAPDSWYIFCRCFGYIKQGAHSNLNTFIFCWSIRHTHTQRTFPTCKREHWKNMCKIGVIFDGSRFPFPHCESWMVQTAFPAQNGETDWWMPGPWLLELSDTFVGDLLTCRINNNFSLLSLKMLKANNKHTWQQQHNWKNRNTWTQKIYEINAKITWLLGSRKQHYLISKRQHHIDYINKKLASASIFFVSWSAAPGHNPTKDQGASFLRRLYFYGHSSGSLVLSPQWNPQFSFDIYDLWHQMR